MPLAEAFHATIQIRVDDKLCGFGSSWECSAGYNANTSGQTLTNALLTDVLPSLLDCLASDVTFEGIYAVGVQPDTNLPYRQAGESQVGLRTGEALPANSCAVITLQTDSPTAVRQGRCYVSGISKDDLTSGTFDPAFVAAQLDALADALSGNVSVFGQTFQPVIVQRIIAGLPVGPNLLPITSARVTAIPYTQRRRTTTQLGTKS